MQSRSWLCAPPGLSLLLAADTHVWVQPYPAAEKMGKGNAIKSAMSRARNEDNAPKAGGGGAAGKAARTSGQTKATCAICKAEVNASSKVQPTQHQESKHAKMTFAQCFPDWVDPE